MTAVLYAVEGATDIPFAEALIASVGRTPRVGPTPSGKHALGLVVARWNSSSNRAPSLVLRDWDFDDQSPCAGDLVTSVMGGPNLARCVSVRIVVRSIEAWAMADRKAFSAFFGISLSSVPDDPEALLDPKATLVTLCRKSGIRAVRDGVPPRVGAGRSVGPEYQPLLAEFGRSSWRVGSACDNAPSLLRAVTRLTALVRDGIW